MTQLYQFLVNVIITSRWLPLNDARATDTIGKKVGQIMYATNENKTAIQSRQMIATALFQLMKKKPFDQITVTEICKEAAIGRKTFYRNFELREDVIAFWLDQMVEEYEHEIEGLNIEAQLRHHFEYVKRHKDVFGVLYTNQMLSMASDRFVILLPKTMPVWSENPTEQEYRSGYIMAGIEAVQKIWIGRGCQESIDEIVDIIQKSQEKQIPVQKIKK